MFHYLFGFSGRANRAKQWAIILVGLAFEVIVVMVFSLVVGFAAVGKAFEQKTPVGEFFAMPQVHTFILLFCALYLLMLYIAVAVSTKRLHDRNKAVWWLLIFFVLPQVLNIPRYMEMGAIFTHFDQFIKAAQQNPQQPFVESPLAIIGGGAAALINLWAFVELFCLRGTVGDNRYGPDPLAGQA